MGSKIVAIYLTVLALSSVIMGYVLNVLFNIVGIGSLEGRLVQDYSGRLSLPSLIFSFIFLCIISVSLYRVLQPRLGPAFVDKRKGKAAIPSMMTIGIEGMSCRNCANRVIESLNKVKNIRSVSVNLKNSTATISGNADIHDIKNAVASAGFSVK